MFENLKSHLYALQLLEYDPNVFVSWWRKNASYFPKESKGHLGWSVKAKYLFLTSLLIYLIISFSPLIAALTSKRPLAVVLLSGFTSLLLFAFGHLFPSVFLLTSLFSLKPYEAWNRKAIINRIRKKISTYPNLKIIGITGSFGKTSVKEMLKQILSAQYKVVAPPGSHNKVMSIAQTVSKDLNDETQILVVEMGAYEKGEIAEICHMVKPQVGVITGITTQHLMRFESLENIKRAKYELIESLPEDGLAVFNLDNNGSKELFQKCALTNKTGYSLKETTIETSGENTYFSLFGQKVKTTLLGRQNVQNILAAATVAKSLGMAEEEIIKTIPLLHAVPHRLELVRAANRSLILDDAYSSNVEGYKASFEFVKSLPNYPKVLVTPGLVEMGKSQNLENAKMAKVAASVFDYAVVVNLENREALVSGFESCGWTLYDPKRETNPHQWSVAYQGILKDKIVFTADTLNQATKEVFPKITKPNSLILLENDLPDIYR